MAFHLKIQTFLFNLRARCRCWQIADPFHNHSLCKKLRRLPLLQLWQARPNLHHSQQIARPAAEKTMGGKAKSQAAATCTWGDHMGMCTVGCLACFKGICTWSACTSLFFLIASYAIDGNRCCRAANSRLYLCQCQKITHIQNNQGTLQRLRRSNVKGVLGNFNPSALVECVNIT